MHAPHAATDPTHRTAGAPEPTDPLPSRRETAALDAAPTSLAGPTAFLFPKTDAIEPVRCAAIWSRRIEEVPADGRGGGLCIDIDDVFSLPTSASTLGPRSPLHGRQGHEDIRHPRIPAFVGTLSTSLCATPPCRWAASLPKLVISLAAVCMALGGGLCIPPPPEDFFWTHILFPHIVGQKLPREHVLEGYSPPLPLQGPSRTGPRQLHVVCHNEIVWGVTIVGSHRL